MKILKEVSKQFSVSKPVFRASLVYDDSAIVFDVKDPYHPSRSTYDDPIAKLLASRFQESLVQVERRFVQSTHLPSAYSEIVRNITTFYCDHSPLKNPRQSKLYKWLNSMEDEYNHPASEGFIALYRYIHGVQKCDDADIQNVLAILDMMKEKYEANN